jgi:hypothetical protein
MGRDLEEAIVINFNVVSWHMAGENDANHRNLSQDSQSPVKDSNPGRPEYEKEGLHFRVFLNPFTTSSEYMLAWVQCPLKYSFSFCLCFFFTSTPNTLIL